MCFAEGVLFLLYVYGKPIEKIPRIVVLSMINYDLPQHITSKINANKFSDKHFPMQGNEQCNCKQKFQLCQNDVYDVSFNCVKTMYFCKYIKLIYYLSQDDNRS